MRGEKIYEYEVDMTSMIDFGIDLTDILEGKAMVPPQGARFNVGFAGRSTGRLVGTVEGTDFAAVRADGRFDLNIHAVIATDDGQRIALSADGVAVPRVDEPVLDLSENVRLTTAAPAYAWVNSIQIWATGTANLATGKIRLEGYAQ
jgi:hypothetical protein